LLKHAFVHCTAQRETLVLCATSSHRASTDVVKTVPHSDLCHQPCQKLTKFSRYLSLITNRLLIHGLTRVIQATYSGIPVYELCVQQTACMRVSTIFTSHAGCVKASQSCAAAPIRGSTQRRFSKSRVSTNHSAPAS
jgi:hypothetical protein